MTTITVTREHIAKGKRQQCNFCPIALAAIDAFPDAARISVGTDEMDIQDRSGNLVEVALPVSAARFVAAYDDCEPVEPFSFELDYPAVTA